MPETTIVLKDGSTVAVRPVDSHDEAALTAFYSNLSPESLAFRFFASPQDIADVAKRLVISNYESQFGLIATSGNLIVGHSVYIVTGGRRAEMGIAIANEFQGRGLGLLLFAQLADAAAHNGIEVFEAVVRADNHRMLDMLRESGFPMRLRSEPGEIHAELPTALSEEAGMHFERRQSTAAQAAVKRVLAPRALAVIGTVLEGATTGGAVVRDLVNAGYRGHLHLVNGTGVAVDGYPAFTSVRDVPGEVDVAIVTSPAAGVIDVASECA